MLSKWYWLIPNVVLFSKDLKDKEKLLFCLISSLCAEKGYCRATNKYLWEKLWLSKLNISRYISSLTDKGYITTTFDKSTLTKRTIGIAENSKGYCWKQQGGIAENNNHNSISNSISNNNYTPLEIFDYTIIDKFTKAKQSKHSWVQYQINTQWWDKYISKQYEAVDKLITKHKLSSEHIIKSLRFLLDYDNFWSTQIQSVSKLLTKQKETKIPLIIVIKDEVENRKSKISVKQIKKTDVKSLHKKKIFVVPK